MRIRHLIARVRRAYARIGMRPIRGYFLRGRTRHCCPLTALYLAETGKPFHRESVLARADDEFGKDMRTVREAVGETPSDPWERS